MPLLGLFHVEDSLRFQGPITHDYCCEPAVTYSNRFIAMPSSRNRILGTQLFYFDIKGFMHWGFNFYFTRQSVSAIDPYRSTDSGGLFPAGDAFIVYPGKNGQPEDSIREIVFTEALQDQRALQLLGTLVPREKILEYLDASVPEGKFIPKAKQLSMLFGQASIR